MYKIIRINGKKVIKVAFWIREKYRIIITIKKARETPEKKEG